MIPEILHQTWKSKTDIPEQFRLWRKSFADINPSLEIRLYDDADNRSLLADTFPCLLSTYDSFPAEIFRCDYIRAVYLFKYGGYYADLDFQCLAPLASLEKSGGDVIVGAMGTDESFRHSIPNAFMASRPSQGFWIGFLALVEKAWAANRTHPIIASRPEYIVGPVTLKTAVQKLRRNPGAFRQMALDFIHANALPVSEDDLDFGKLTILPGHVLYPLCWTDRVHRRFLDDARDARRVLSVAEARALFPKSIAVTYWSNSWQGWHGRAPIAEV